MMNAGNLDRPACEEAKSTFHPASAKPQHPEWRKAVKILPSRILLVALVLFSILLGLMPSQTVEAKTLYYFIIYESGSVKLKSGDYDTETEARTVADKKCRELLAEFITPTYIPDYTYNIFSKEVDDRPNASIPEPPQGLTIYVTYMGTDNTYLGNHTWTGNGPGVYTTMVFALDFSASGYNYSFSINPASYTFSQPGDYEITVYYDPTQNPVQTSPPPITPTQPGVPAVPTQPSSPNPPPAPQPSRIPWDDIQWDDEDEEPSSPWDFVRDDVDENNMIIHVIDAQNDLSLQGDITFEGLPTGTEVIATDIAPDIPGYYLDALTTKEKFIQQDGLYEDALYYLPDPFGFEDWFTDDELDPHDPFKGEDNKGCPGDPMCPDYPGNPQDPDDPKAIPKPPTGTCPAKKGGTVCEQAGPGSCTPLEPTEIKKPSGKRAPIPPAKPGKKPINQDFAKKQSWDETYDVIVYGFDMAGAVAALTVAEDGGRVIILDKAPAKEIGSYTKSTHQEFIYAKDQTTFRTFMQSWNEGYDHIDPEILKAFSEGAEFVPAWFTAHGATKLYRFPGVMYEELEGSDGAGVFRLSQDFSYDKAGWKLILKAMQAYNKKNIFFLSEATVTDLVQDPTSGTVLGVKVHLKDNKDVNFQATGGVILAGGGFENNESMVENFLQMPKVRAKYSQYNDGDAITLAMRAGADLWHMDNVLGYELHLASLDKQWQFRNPIQGIKNYQLGGRSCFVVGPNGRRFTDEGALVRQGHVYRTGEWRAQEIPAQAWAIVDHKGLIKAPLAQGWSDDNLNEVNAGKIFKADSLAELAQLLELDPAELEAQFQDYQQACAEGRDVQFGRRPQNLFALDETGPFYAIPLEPVLEATLGGPRRNEACQILDTRGEVIPHLYGAGSLGSFLPDIFPQGADLTEAIVTGQIAGVNALTK